MLARAPPPLNTSSFPPTMQQQSQSSSQRFPKQYQPPVLPPNFQGNPQYQTQPPISIQPPVSSPNFSSNQHYSAQMTNGMNQPLVQHPYLNSGLPPSSTQMQSTSVTSIPYSAPPTIANTQFQNLTHPPPNQSPSNMSGAPSYQPNQYPHGQPSYNGPPPSFPPNNRPSPPPTIGYPPQSHYPNLSGPPTMLGSQLNAPNTYPGQPPSSGPAQQPMPQSRIDPNMVPNVIQVLEQSQEKIQEPFITNAPGLLPPLVGTNFICQDQGSCNPCFMRSTAYSIPNATDLVKQSHIPIALSISPLADLRSDELEPPITNFGEIGPVRCHRCKAYMCSFMQFIDGGKRFICCFCEAATDVATEYFNHLDHSGRRVDWYQRPELCLGSYEILATQQYCKDEKWPEPPAFLFMIDVSYNSVRSGLVEYICHILKTELLDYLPKDKNAETSTVRVGFATFDKQIHFYNIKNTLGQPQMMVVSELEDIFVPLLDGFLCSPQTSRNVINTLLDNIPQTFANTQETETVLAPVIEAGIQALKVRLDKKIFK
ncbi:unnamed protein product [Rotaria sp. Silwood1]|nr:unnamed protein product [Rotaria sp. Silwood1]